MRDRRLQHGYSAPHRFAIVSVRPAQRRCQKLVPNPFASGPAETQPASRRPSSNRALVGAAHLWAAALRAVIRAGRARRRIAQPATAVTPMQPRGSYNRPDQRPNRPEKTETNDHQKKQAERRKRADRSDSPDGLALLTIACSTCMRQNGVPQFPDPDATRLGHGDHTARGPRRARAETLAVGRTS